MLSYNQTNQDSCCKKGEVTKEEYSIWNCRDVRNINIWNELNLAKNLKTTTPSQKKLLKMFKVKEKIISISASQEGNKMLAGNKEKAKLVNSHFGHFI